MYICVYVDVCTYIAVDEMQEMYLNSSSLELFA